MTHLFIQLPLENLRSSPPHWKVVEKKKPRFSKFTSKEITCKFKFHKYLSVTQKQQSLTKQNKKK